MSAANIDDVVTRLDGIIVRAIADGDRRGYFAALYNRVTQRVRDGIQRGEFEDGARMERLDTIFANRYLDAYDHYAGGAAMTAAWRRAFDAAKHDGLLVIHHLLLGMNAHITLDLGIAAAEVAPGAAIAALEHDFNHINDVLASLVRAVEDELIHIVGRWEPPLGATFTRLESAAGGVERTAAMLLMDEARVSAWQFATSLAQLGERERIARIARRDEETALLSETVLLASPAVMLLAGGGSHDVAANIRILAQGEGLDARPGQ